jgi:chromosome segregation ATPase
MTPKANDLDRIPAIKPAQDEVASYRRGTRAEAPKQSNFNGILVFAIALMAIMMGIGGYALYALQQQLDMSNQLLARAQENVQGLEDRLSRTGDIASKNFQSMEKQINTNVSEIDKLWGVAYRQNRPKIQDNEKAIEAANKSISQIDARIKQVVSTVEQVRGEFQKLTGEMTQARQQVLRDNQQMVAQVSAVKVQVQDQSVVNEANRRTLAALDKKMADVQEAINVIDRYRQQLNVQLRELQDAVAGGQR